MPNFNHLVRRASSLIAHFYCSPRDNDAMLKLSGFLALWAALAFGSTTANAACPADANPAQWVDGGDICLAVSVAGAKDAGSSPTLVVLVHGDGSDGGPTDYLYPFARSIAG